MVMSPSAIADNTSNAVNERIPVSSAQMEAHWQVDCSSLWKQLKEAGGEAMAPGCALPLDLKKQLMLCAFIYQPPGEELAYSGPDYRSAVSELGCYPSAPGLEK